MQIVEWYDELVRLTDSPVARLNRAVAVGEADGPRAGLAALAELDPALPRYTAVAAYLHERDGDPVTAAGCTPKRPDRRPASPNATTSRARPPVSTRNCAVERRAAYAEGGTREAARDTTTATVTTSDDGATSPASEGIMSSQYITSSTARRPSDRAR